MVQLIPLRKTAQVTDVLFLETFAVQLEKCPQQFTADRMVIDEFLLKKRQTAWSDACPRLPIPSCCRPCRPCHGRTIYAAEDGGNSLCPEGENPVEWHRQENLSIQAYAQQRTPGEGSSDPKKDDNRRASARCAPNRTVPPVLWATKGIIVRAVPRIKLYPAKL